jgi:hypothetical protein
MSCPKCGWEATPDGPGGQCPRCGVILAKAGEHSTASRPPSRPEGWLAAPGRRRPARHRELSWRLVATLAAFLVVGLSVAFLFIAGLPQRALWGPTREQLQREHVRVWHGPSPITKEGSDLLEYAEEPLSFSRVVRIRSNCPGVIEGRVAIWDTTVDDYTYTPHVWRSAKRLQPLARLLRERLTLVPEQASATFVIENEIQVNGDIRPDGFPGGGAHGSFPVYVDADGYEHNVLTPVTYVLVFANPSQKLLCAYSFIGTSPARPRPYDDPPDPGDISTWIRARLGLGP